MDLIKQEWNSEDILKFNQYFLSLSNQQKIDWTKKIYATNKKCLAIKVPILKQIAKQICKGDYNGFLNKQTHIHIEDDILTACIISCIKDYNLQQKYVEKFLGEVDSWVCTDTLKLNTSIQSFDEVLTKSKTYAQSNKPFIRRFAFVQLLKFAKYEHCLPHICEMINCLFFEQEYYVNMAIAWLICEMAINFPQEIYNFLKKYSKQYKNTNNLFIVKKSISKCCDSYRISENNKEKFKSILK